MVWSVVAVLFFASCLARRTILGGRDEGEGFVGR